MTGCGNSIQQPWAPAQGINTAEKKFGCLNFERPHDNVIKVFTGVCLPKQNSPVAYSPDPNDPTVYPYSWFGSSPDAIGSLQEFIANFIGISEMSPNNQGPHSPTDDCAVKNIACLMVREQGIYNFPLCPAACYRAGDLFTIAEGEDGFLKCGFVKTNDPEVAIFRAVESSEHGAIIDEVTGKCVKSGLTSACALGLICYRHNRKDFLATAEDGVGNSSDGESAEASKPGPEEQSEPIIEP